VDWEGSARKAYDTILPEQKAAADDAVQKIEYVSGWLGKIAQENVNYVTDALHMLTEFVGKLVDAVVKAGGVITAVSAWNTLAEEAGNITTKGLDQMLKAADRFAAVANEVRDLTAQSTDRSKLGAGWPQAVRA
jgi:methyl-accepting chemotaxis protein